MDLSSGQGISHQHFVPRLPEHIQQRPHKRLVIKLKGYDIQGKLLGWIGAFLQGQQQQVNVGSSHSSWDSVTRESPKDLC